MIFPTRTLPIAIARLLFLGCVAVCVASLGSGTIRRYRIGLPDETLQADGPPNDARRAFLFGLAALLVAVLGRRKGATPRRHALAAAAILAGAAWVVGTYRLRVLAERDAPRADAFHIAVGLLVAAIIGCGAFLLIVAVDTLVARGTSEAFQ